MKSLQVVAFAGATLAALTEQVAANLGSFTVETTGKAETVNCLDAFNKARAAAGLDPFTSASNTIDLSKEADALDRNKTVPEVACNAMFDGKEYDCDAAVQYFKDAGKKLTSPPPEFKDTDFTQASAGDFYQNTRNLGFIALYNPQPNATLQCGFFDCTRTFYDSQATDKSSASNEQKGTVHTYGLACSSVSDPKALTNGNAPFTQEQFDKIKEAVNSAYTAVPAAAALLAAAAGLVLF
ncbi:hypothetical protein Emed_005420 [Eimeria media]